ncbi:AP-3 complex subunit mu-1, partial [Coemansia sp. RSA 25]
PDQSHTIELSADAGQSGNRPVEKIQVRVPLPAQAYNIRVQCKSGTHTVSNVRLPQVEWSLKSLGPADRGARLTIQYLVRASSAATGAPQLSPSPSSNQSALAAFVDFEVAGFSVSSIKVDSLKMLVESYKLFKGVRYVTKAGSFQLRF